jgi:hypothetical protein
MKIVLAFLIIAFAASFASFVKSAKATSDSIISVVPQSIDWNGKSIGESFFVEITISSSDIPIWSGEIGIGYNPIVLECTGFSKGPAIDSTWLWVPGTINNDAGYVTSSGWSCVSGQEPGWTGTGSFIVYTFRVKNYGNSTLDLTIGTVSPDKYYKTELSKNVNSAIIEIEPITVADGFFANGETSQPPPSPKHDIAIRYIKCLQSVAYVGDIVKIEVGVENKGDFTEDFNVTLYADKDIRKIFDEYIIGIIHVAELAPENTKAVLFEWNTANVSIGSYWFSARLSLLPGEPSTEDNILIRGAYLGGICNRPNEWRFDLLGALCQVGASASAVAIMVVACVGIFKMLTSENLPSFRTKQIKHVLATHNPFRKST